VRCFTNAASLIVLGLSALLGATSAAAVPPQRIVSLSPHATELLFSAGAGDKVVAVSEACDYPEAVKSLPKISGYRGTNVEAVVALKPDLVVAWPSGNRAADIEAIKRFNIPVHASELATLASITAEVRRFSDWAISDTAKGAAVHRADDADKLVDSLRKKYATARKVRLFYQLGSGRLFTLTDKHVIGEALAVCGAENVFGGLALPAPEVSHEAVLAARPDAVVLSDAKSITAVTGDWQARKLYTASQAKQRVIAANGALLHRPTLRTFGAVQAMCESIDQVRRTLR
jgi:vitamin B12 transport system substrate-binding protein